MKYTPEQANCVAAALEASYDNVDTGRVTRGKGRRQGRQAQTENLSTSARDRRPGAEAGHSGTATSVPSGRLGAGLSGIKA